MAERARIPVRVEFHTAGDYTRLKWPEAPGMSDFDWFEIPTAAIPNDLRRIGSEFILVLLNIDRSDNPKPDELRRRIADSFRIERLTS